MKRRWWLWLLLALACSVIVSVVSELTGVSMLHIFGWTALASFGVVALILMIGLVILVTGFVFLIGWLVKFLLECFISNKEILSIILGSLGFCSILVGWALVLRESEWTFFVMMLGFSMGCFAGAEYQGHKLEREKLEYELEQVPDKKEEMDEDKGSLLKEMSISELENFKDTYKDNKSIVKILDGYIEAKRKATKEF